ncbi:polysaccharide deacetylase family protein [Desulfolithobacter sp.]
MTTSSLWTRSLSPDMPARLQTILNGPRATERDLIICFRADDIGRMDSKFIAMMELFQHFQTPLNLAVVPCWIDQPSWETMDRFHVASPLWCWHQHGLAHSNHQGPESKKAEFGEDRAPEDIRRDLRAGRDHLRNLLGDLFCPVFTPPWNRCSRATLECLPSLGFQAVSRFRNARPLPPAELPDLAMNVDLHTRKESEPEQGMNNLLQELEQAAQTGFAGIMLHHQLMNGPAFSFLEILLETLVRAPQVRVLTFPDLLRKDLLCLLPSRVFLI